jgi:hypothetical protein
MKNSRLLREFVRSIILAEERTPAASMNQMAYAATLPTVDAREDKSDEKVIQKVKRFHGKEFGKKAAGVFKLFPQEVYVVPVVAEGRSNRVLGGLRVKIYEPEAGIALLRDLGLKYDLDSLGSKLASGATVFLNINEAIEKGLLPTPWMMIHAVFDSDQNGSSLDAIYSNITNQVFEIMQKSGLSNNKIAFRSTMASARNLPWGGNKYKDDYAKSIIDTEFDLPAELITQSIVSSKGLDFILDADHPQWAARDQNRGNKPNSEISGKIAQLKADIDALDLKNRFHKSTAGKVIAVGTGTFS